MKTNVILWKMQLEDRIFLGGQVLYVSEFNWWIQTQVDMG